MMHSPFGPLAMILTAIVAGLGTAGALVFPWPLVALCLVPTAIGLTLLWLSADVEAPIDRIARAVRPARPAVKPAPVAAPIARAA